MLPPSSPTRPAFHLAAGRPHTPRNSPPRVPNRSGEWTGLRDCSPSARSVSPARSERVSVAVHAPPSPGFGPVSGEGRREVGRQRAGRREVGRQREESGHENVRRTDPSPAIAGAPPGPCRPRDRPYHLPLPPSPRESPPRAPARLLLPLLPPPVEKSPPRRPLSPSTFGEKKPAWPRERSPPRKSQRPPWTLPVWS
jgi:hypothetical protein